MAYVHHRAGYDSQPLSSSQTVVLAIEPRVSGYHILLELQLGLSAHLMAQGLSVSSLGGGPGA